MKRFLFFSIYNSMGKSSVKQAVKEMGLFPFWLFVYPLLGLENYSLSSIFIYYLLMVSVFMAMIPYFFHGNVMDKTLFLCPIDREERRKWLNKACLFQIGCVVITGCFSTLILLFCGMVKQLWYLPVYVVSVGIMAETVFLHTKSVNLSNSFEKGLGFYPVVMGAVLVLSFACAVLCSLAAAEREGFGVAGNGILAAMLIMQLLLFIKLTVDYREKLIELLIDYEKQQG